MSYSFQQAAWKRLRKNKGAVFGLIVIVLAVLVAIFAYFIAPDSSPNANRIILEIDGEKPGYDQQFIKVKKERKVIRSGFVQRLQLDPETPALAAVGNEIAEFVRPLFIAPNSVRAWQPGGPRR